jgi:hypothetical protein
MKVIGPLGVRGFARKMIANERPKGACYVARRSREKKNEALLNFKWVAGHEG